MAAVERGEGAATRSSRAGWPAPWPRRADRNGSASNCQHIHAEWAPACEHCRCLRHAGVENAATKRRDLAHGYRNAAPHHGRSGRDERHRCGKCRRTPKSCRTRPKRVRRAKRQRPKNRLGPTGRRCYSAVTQSALRADPFPRRATPRAAVAQLVEHVIRNDGVVGSSPITGTRFSLNSKLN